MAEEKFRLVTRSDFDGLVCAVLFKAMDMIGEIKFVHPKDMQEGTVLVLPTDITANLPYVKTAHLAFDHHLSETVRLDRVPENCIIDPQAPSAARVVYDHYGGRARFPGVSEEMMAAVDKSDSGQFSRDEILDPRGWVRLNFLIDPRSGLGRFKDFRISDQALMLQLIESAASRTIDQILALPDVAERVALFSDHQEKAKDQIRRCTAIHRNLGVLELRNEATLYAANRFLIYALFPEINISVHAMWGRNRLNTVFAVGKSVLNRTARTNIGTLMLRYGGGGHENAGTCQVDSDDADRVLAELIAEITADG